MITCINGGEDMAAYDELLREIARLEADTYGTPWTIDMLRDMMQYDHNILFAETEDDILRGYLFANLVMEQSELLRITVSPTYRRQGLGEYLLSSYLGELKGICNCSLLEVRDGNVPARSLYENFGYVEAHRRKNYYSHPVEDAIVYTLDI